MSWSYHFFNANNRVEAFRERLMEAAEHARQVIFKSVPARRVDVVFKHDPKLAVPGFGIGGMAPQRDEIFISLDMDFEGIEKAIVVELPRTLAHEYHHNLRHGGVGYGKTLGEVIVSEGLADHFSLEVFGGEAPAWSMALNEDQRTDFLQRAKEGWDDDYDHAAWFFGRGNMPNWTGYSLGFEIVGRFMKSFPDKKASRLWDTPAHEFLLFAG